MNSLFWLSFALNNSFNFSLEYSRKERTLEYSQPFPINPGLVKLDIINLSYLKHTSLNCFSKEDILVLFVKINSSIFVLNLLMVEFIFIFSSSLFTIFIISNTFLLISSILSLFKFTFSSTLFDFEINVLLTLFSNFFMSCRISF